jgi:hypothetical protein
VGGTESKFAVFCGTTKVKKGEINEAGYNPKLSTIRINIKQTSTLQYTAFPTDLLLYVSYATAAMFVQYDLSGLLGSLIHHSQGSLAIGLQCASPNQSE